MKRSTLLSTILVSSSILGFADPGPEPAPLITPATTGFNLDWDGANGNTYFIEYSSDLVTWQYMPAIESGTGNPLGYGFSAPDDRLFLRLKYTDVATSNALTDDFDGDGISNWDEVRIGGSGTSPFLWDTAGDAKSDYFADSDGNGMSDGWELLHGGIGVLDPNGNSDEDSLSNLEESLMGSNPLLADTDSDGKDDDEESFWWDDQIEWPRNPEPQYVVIELSGLTLDANKYGNGVESYSSIQSGDFSTQDDWVIQSLSNAGHVLVVEDHRGSAADYGRLNPATIPNSIINHVWNPSSQNWVTLKNDSVGSSNQTALAVANAVSKNGKIGGFAWIPLGKMEDDTLVATGGPGVERVITLWNTIDTATAPSLLTQLNGTPFTSFSDENDVLEIYPYSFQLNGISDIDEPLYEKVNEEGVSLFLGTNVIAEPDEFSGFGGYSMTSQGDVFYEDETSYSLVLKEHGASTVTTIEDDESKPLEMQFAIKATHTTNDSDILALSPSIWIRDAGTWKKVPGHPSKTFITGKGISSDGVILGWAGNSITTNGKTVPIKDLVSNSDWTDFKMAKMNDGGMMAGRATKGGSEKIVLLLPVEVTVAFGVGPDTPPNAGNKDSRQLLEEYLDSIKISKEGDIWAVKGKDEDGNEKVYGVEIVDDQDKLGAALQADGRVVVFDGHSNFGMGPNWGQVAHKTIDSFTNYGVGYTDIPISYIGDGTESDPIVMNQNGGIPVGDQEALDAMTRIGLEGWAYLVPGANGVLASEKNYIPAPLTTERFPNGDGVGVGQLFNLKQNAAGEDYHYTVLGSQRILVQAPDSDVPAKLGYKTFFYNSCSTGVDYIESFKHGDFIYTTESCFVHTGTKLFVQGVIEGKTTAEILPLLNQPGVGNNQQGAIIYEFKSF